MEGVALGVIGRWLIMHLHFPKAAGEIQLRCCDEIAAFDVLLFNLELHLRMLEISEWKLETGYYQHWLHLRNRGLLGVQCRLLKKVQCPVSSPRYFQLYSRDPTTSGHI